jgi:predicted ATPase/DNA-binding CsgD family transcriptional regulator/transcriptional regulator with XRE-family HTH domain
MTHEVSFGQWLKQRRKALDLTRGELAAQVGCSAASIYKLETDERRPSKQIVERLAECLGIGQDERLRFMALARAPRNTAQPPPSPSSLGPVRLPVPLTPLIGRAQELAAAQEYLLSDTIRLVTMTGPPGVGKTRLSVEVAAALEAFFPSGISFVALASIDDPDLVAPTIFQTLGLAGAKQISALASLSDWLRDKQFLLLLDNFEQLTAAAAIVMELLTACRRVKILVTSRAPLLVRGEQQFPVAPLPVPDPAQFQSVELLARSPAVALFVARAQAVKPDFAISEENAAAVAAICTRLNGLPLAIELIAARTKLLPPSALLAHLDSTAGQPSLPLLTLRSRDLPERHQALSDAIGWSYDLLKEGERILFERLAVFIGGWTLEAAEAICRSQGTSDRGQLRGDGQIGSLPPGPYALTFLDELTVLLDNSLIMQQGRADGSVRFMMLEMIRAYALEHLIARGELEGLRRQHAAFYCALAEEAEPHLTGAAQQGWLNRLERDHDNLRAALRWALERQQIETAARLSSALWRFWLTRGHLDEGRKWLEQALALLNEQSGPAHMALRAKALNAAGVLAFWQSDHVRAEALHRESFTLYQAANDRRGSATTLTNLGLVARARGEYTSAQIFLEESLALRRAMSDRWGSALALLNLGLVVQDQGDYARAVTLYEESLGVYRELGHSAGIANLLNNLGLVANYQGNYARAAALYQESLALHQELGFKLGILNVLLNLGQVAYAQGDYAQASSLYEESLVLSQELGNKDRVAEGIEGLAAVVGAQGRLRQAAWLFGAAEVLRETIDAPIAPPDRATYDRNVAAVRAQLDAVTFELAWADGRAMPPAQVIAAQRQAIVTPRAVAPGTAPQDHLCGLTAREREVLRLVAIGLTNTQVAEKLVLSPLTINAYLRSIYSKLGVSSRTAATRYAIDHQLI